jgi:protein SCO1/2
VAALVAVAAVVLGVGAVASARRTSDGPGGRADTVDAQATGWHGAYLAEPQPRPSFALTDTSGAPYDFARETGGRLTLLFFGYTSCPDVCPIQMATLSAALDRPGMPDPIVVFVTTDPARDTPERLRRWLDRFDTGIVGLTGTPAQIAEAEAAAGVARSVAVADGGGPPAPGADRYEVGHAAQIVAYTPDDLSHVQYPFGVRRQDWEADLPRLADTWGGGARRGPADAREALAVTGAWAAAGDAVTAVYLSIRNDGGDDRLVGASTDVADRVSAMGPGVAMPAGGGTAAGDALDLEVPTGTTDLAPGGTHLMLEDLARPLEPGEEVALRLVFARAGAVEVPVEILTWDDVVERRDR